MFSLKQSSFSIAALGAILAVGISSSTAQALNIVSGSVSGIWEYDYDGADGLNVGDAFTAVYTYDSDSITEYDYSSPDYYNYKQRHTSLLSLVLNSGSYSYTFDPSYLSSGYSSISWSSFQSTSPTGGYGLWDYEGTYLSALDYLASGYNHFYAYDYSGVDYYGNPYDYDSAYTYSYDYDTQAYLTHAYGSNPVRFSGATPAPTAVPTPALLPGLVGLGVAALRKRNENQGQEVAEAAQS